MKNLADHIGASYAEAVLHAPDNGFFADFCPATSLPYFSDPNVSRVVTINLASDMADIRFAGIDDGVEGFATEFARAIDDLAQRDSSIGFLFAPHIFRDLDVISRVIDRLSDRMRRTRVAQAPYGTGDAAARTVFGLYAASDVCVGMRFHANVVPIGNLRQSLGLMCYQQVSALYDENRSAGSLCGCVPARLRRNARQPGDRCTGSTWRSVCRNASRRVDLRPRPAGRDHA